MHVWSIQLRASHVNLGVLNTVRAESCAHDVLMPPRQISDLASASCLDSFNTRACAAS